MLPRKDDSDVNTNAMSLLFLVDYHHMCLVFSSFLKESAVVYTVQNFCK